MTKNSQHTSTASSLVATLCLTAFASIGTSVVWNGLPFIAKQYYGFDEYENFSLFLLIGLLYIVCAFASGKLTSLFNKVCSSRAILALLLVMQGTVCTLPLLFESSWVVWVAGGVAGGCSAWLWPLVESYLVAGRHGQSMRSAIGYWNTVWMISVATAMIAIAPLMESHASMAIVGLGFANLIAVIPLYWFEQEPAAHDETEAQAHVPDGYKPLLKGARILLPLSYIFNGVLAPILPFVLSRINVDVVMQTPIAAIWMFARVLIVGVMAHVPFWHGRWAVLWGGMIAMSLGLIAIFAATSLSILILGLALFGSGMGVTYYAAIYYALAVGRAEVEAGGTHEALIGGGYMVGPVIGLGTLQFGPEHDSDPFFPLAISVFALMAVGILCFVFIWRKDR